MLLLQSLYQVLECSVKAWQNVTASSPACRKTDPNRFISFYLWFCLPIPWWPFPYWSLQARHCFSPDLNLNVVGQCIAILSINTIGLFISKQLNLKTESTSGLKGLTMISDFKISHFFLFLLIYPCIFREPLCVLIYPPKQSKRIDISSEGKPNIYSLNWFLLGISYSEERFCFGF